MYKESKSFLGATKFFSLQRPASFKREDLLMKSQKVTTVGSQDVGKRNGKRLRRMQEMQPNYKALPLLQETLPLRKQDRK